MDNHLASWGLTSDLPGYNGPMWAKETSEMDQRLPHLSGHLPGSQICLCECSSLPQ